MSPQTHKSGEGRYHVQENAGGRMENMEGVLELAITIL